jgi:8-oxo-dGTP diphosphatase
MKQHVRVSIKAIVIEGGRLLAIHSHDAVGDWYSLPGGGQHPGETVHQALRRECLEEIGCDVEIGRLRFVRDYIADHHEFAEIERGVAQVELMFECRLRAAPGTEAGTRPVPGLGASPDTTQTGVEWLDLARLEATQFYPRALVARLVRPDRDEEPVYLGDVN